MGELGDGLVYVQPMKEGEKGKGMKKEPTKGKKGSPMWTKGNETKKSGKDGKRKVRIATLNGPLITVTRYRSSLMKRRGDLRGPTKWRAKKISI